MCLDSWGRFYFIYKMSPVEPFVRVPKSAITSKKIGPQAFRVYCLIISKPPGWDFCYRRIADEIGISGKTANNAIRELEKSGALTREKGKGRKMKYKAFFPYEVTSTPHNRGME